MEHKDNTVHSRRDGGYHGDATTDAKSSDSTTQDSDENEAHSVDSNPADSEPTSTTPRGVVAPSPPSKRASSPPGKRASSPPGKRRKVLEPCRQNSARRLPSLRMLERQGARGNLDNASAPKLCRGMAPGTVVELKSPTHRKPSRAKVTTSP